MDNKKVVAQFCEYYYTNFARDRSRLESLYVDQSMLTFQGTSFKGRSAIKEKMVEGIRFGTVKHENMNFEFQPFLESGILVLVTGAMSTDGDRALPFSEAFTLAKKDGRYIIVNQIFRFNSL
ncbi:Nuclear transport factor 2 [Aduncisulcus paluster]|uniref:Nuclear transport factor 2 n=1 Tax=Aduncisulcus paluster TaxID=2918883 RepID=A0ABQ5K2I7_9EUKA|nr:Nuclear transport factor 2 [Aduncisulcus paluster]